MTEAEASLGRDLLESIPAVQPAAEDDSGRLALFVIAVGCGLTSLAMNSWVPFLTLYMKELGAESDASALFWAGLAASMVGFSRLVSGPIWGILSDRMGRKVMYVRALFFAGITTLVAAFATEPWHVVVAFVVQGMFSGFIPAATALTSVTVPERRMSQSLGYIAAGQYIGSMTGPVVGSILAILFGFRGAIAASALLPVIAAATVFLLVPRDHIERKAPAAPGEKAKGGTIRSLFTGQFGIVLAIYCFIFAATQLIRIAAPIALEHAAGHPPSKALVGLAFTLADVASVVGLFGISRRTSNSRFRILLIVFILVAGGSTAMLGFVPGAPLWILGFCIVSLALAAMIPAVNTMIAASAGRERRGTAFGVASSAQSLAFIVGPLGGAFFEATSMMFGFFALGLAFLLMGAITARFLRDPVIAT